MGHPILFWMVFFFTAPRTMERMLKSFAVRLVWKPKKLPTVAVKISATTSLKTSKANADRGLKGEKRVCCYW